MESQNQVLLCHGVLLHNSFLLPNTMWVYSIWLWRGDFSYLGSVFISGVTSFWQLNLGIHLTHWEEAWGSISSIQTWNMHCFLTGSPGDASSWEGLTCSLYVGQSWGVEMDQCYLFYWVTGVLTWFYRTFALWEHLNPFQYVCMSVCVFKITLVFVMGSLGGLDFADVARVAGQWAPGGMLVFVSPVFRW